MKCVGNFQDKNKYFLFRGNGSDYSKIYLIPATGAYDIDKSTPSIMYYPSAHVL